MKKGYYYFGECGSLGKMLAIIGGISFSVSAVFFFLGGWAVLIRPWAVGNYSYAMWCLFFLLICVVAFLIDFSIHKICRDIAALLKQMEDRKDN